MSPQKTQLWNYFYAKVISQLLIDPFHINSPTLNKLIPNLSSNNLLHILPQLKIYFEQTELNVLLQTIPVIIIEAESKQSVS